MKFALFLPRFAPQLCTFLLALIVASPLSASVIIAEFDANNNGAIEDADGNQPDWIELRNTGASSVSLSGWGLSDDATQPGKWIFPNVSIPAGQQVLVFASGKDWRIAGLELHTSFKLDADGGDVVLSQPDGFGGWTTVHSITAYPRQRPTITFGYAASVATGLPGFLQTPTPGAVNDPTVVYAFVKDTDFDFTRGYYANPFTLTITTATPGAMIIYTLDGSEPSLANGTQVPAASELVVPVATIPIPTTTIVRARAMMDGLGSTNIDTHTYLFGADVLDQDASHVTQSYAQWGHSGPDWAMDPRVTTHSNPEDKCVPADFHKIPTVSLVMNWADLFGQPDGIYIEGEGIHKRASFEIINPDGSDIDPNATPAEHGRGVAMVFGGSSTGKRWKTDKLSFRFNFWRDLDSVVLGDEAVGSYDRLVLDARLNQVWTQSQNFEQRQFGDYTRDAVLTDLEKELGSKSVHSQHVHLFLNGLYWGLYTLHERPDNHFAAAYFGGDNDDYDVVKHGPDEPNFLVDGLRIDPTQPISNANNTAGVNYLSMVSLSSKDLSIPANYDALAAKLDIPAFINHMLANFYGGNYDWPQHNWYASYNRNDPAGRWRFHSWDAEHVFKYVDYPRYDDETGKFEGWDRPDGINLQLLQNPEYRFLFADTAHKYLFNDGAFAVERVWALFEERFNDIDEAIRAESARWGDSGQQNITSSSPLYPELHLRYSNIPSSVPQSMVGQSDTTDFASWYHERERIRTKILGPAPNRATRFVDQLRNAVYNEDHPLGGLPNPMYPMTDAPVFARHGGVVDPGYQLVINNPNAGSAGAVYYTTDGSDPRQPNSSTGAYFSGAVSSSAISYTTAVPVDSRVRIKSRILRDGEWSALTEAEFVLSGNAPEPASAANLVISEIHYHPLDATLDELNAGYTDDGEFEYFEVRNVGPSPVSLEGISMAEGLDLAAVVGGVQELAPGAHALYVANPAAFAYRNGTGYPVAGQFAFSTSLNNGGERLRLLAKDGSTIVDFTYDDVPPWPITPDGYGPSLVLIQPGFRDPALGWNWRASNAIGGSPGDLPVYLSYDEWAGQNFQPSDPGYPGVAQPEADPENDGLTNVEELFYGTDPWAADDAALLPQLTLETFDTGTGPGIYAVFSFRYNREAEEVTFAVEASDSLEDWGPEGLVLIGVPQDNGDGTETRRYRTITPVDQELASVFIRIVLEMQ